MHAIKNFVVVTLGVTLALLMASLVRQPSVSAVEKKGLRAFYLTQDFHDGKQAPTACAAGFHMASMWEILDPSNLRYDTTLGVTRDDSGSGPPIARGWIRTGDGAIASPVSNANCNAWTSNEFEDRGTEINLIPANSWALVPASAGSPWISSLVTCFEIERVWCVED